MNRQELHDRLAALLREADEALDARTVGVVDGMTLRASAKLREAEELLRRHEAGER